MTPGQRIAILFGTMLIAGCVLYPPWVQVRGTAQIRTPLGYSWMFQPPTTPYGGAETPINGAQIDVTRLLFQILGAAAITWGLYAVQGSERESHRKHPTTAKVG